MKKKSKSTQREVDLQKILAQYERGTDNFNPELFQSLLEEFLSSFIVIGYTQKGEPVQITSGNNPQEMDALNTSLQRYIQQFFTAPPMGGEEEPPSA